MVTKVNSKFKLIVLFLLSLLLSSFISNTQVKAADKLDYRADSHMHSISNNNQIAQVEKQKPRNRSFYWNTIDVAIAVQNNGDMLVIETQEYVFNQQHSNQRFRYIPLDKVDDITDVTVSEKNNIIPSQVGRKNNQLWIKWEHELNPPESHTFVIKYRVVGGLHQYTDTTQVYWKAIFGDRSSPIQNAKVTVKLPKSLAVKISSFNYFPPNIPVSFQEIDSQTIEYTAQKPILEGQELKVKVVFPNNILEMTKPKWQTSQVSRIISSNKNSSGKIVIIILTILLWGSLITFCTSFSTRSNPSRDRRSSSKSSRRYYGGYIGGVGGGGVGGGSCGGGGGSCGGGGGGGG